MFKGRASMFKYSHPGSLLAIGLQLVEEHYYDYDAKVQHCIKVVAVLIPQHLFFVIT